MKPTCASVSGQTVLALNNTVVQFAEHSTDNAYTIGATGLPEGAAFVFMLGLSGQPL